jgi:hypothetical protein
MDPQTRLALKRGLAKGAFNIGIFLLVTGGVGYFIAESDPVHGTRDQVLLLGIGAVLTAIGRLAPRWFKSS